MRAVATAASVAVTPTTTNEAAFPATHTSHCPPANLPPAAYSETLRCPSPASTPQVYFRTGAGGGTTGYNASGASVLPGDTQGFSVGGGAGIVTNGNGNNIRSGDPGQTTTAAWRVGVQVRGAACAE